MSTRRPRRVKSLPRPDRLIDILDDEGVTHALAVPDPDEDIIAARARALPDTLREMVESSGRITVIRVTKEH